MKGKRKMKKILLILCFVFGIVACAQKELPIPAAQRGVFMGNPSYKEAETILFKACADARWTIVGKEENIIKVNFNYKGFDFDANIQFFNNQYAILFRKVNSDRGDLEQAYKVYTKYANKLNLIIQRTAARE